MKFSIAVLFLLVVSASRLTSGAECEEGWKAFREYCYLVESKSLSWSDAQAFCDNNDADLVKITSQDENDFVLALARVEAPSLKAVWIGLKMEAPGKGFYWADYSVPAYTNWAPNEPSGDEALTCGIMWTGYTGGLPFRASAYWNDRSCRIIPGSLSAAVCKKLM